MATQRAAEIIGPDFFGHVDLSEYFSEKPECLVAYINTAYRLGYAVLAKHFKEFLVLCDVPLWEMGDVHDWSWYFPRSFYGCGKMILESRTRFPSS